MSLTFRIREDRHGLWCVCRDEELIGSGLSFAQAVKQARKTAREEFERSSEHCTVELSCPEFSTTLARYARAEDEPPASEHAAA